MAVDYEWEVCQAEYSKYNWSTVANIDCDGCVWQLVLNEHDDNDELVNSFKWEHSFTKSLRLNNAGITTVKVHVNWNIDCLQIKNKYQNITYMGCC